MIQPSMWRSWLSNWSRLKVSHCCRCYGTKTQGYVNGVNGSGRGSCREKKTSSLQDAKERKEGLSTPATLRDIPVPPKYASSDFQSGIYWRLRGKLDVPKERWISFPYCEGEDGTLIVAWAGYDHLQLARAISAYYV